MNNKLMGERMKSRRESLGLTLEDVALRVNLNKSTIQRYESGKIENPKLPVVESIAKCLSVVPEWLVCKTDDMHPTMYAMEVPVSGDGNVGSVIVFKPGTMDEKALDAVKAFIKQMGGELV